MATKTNNSGKVGTGCLKHPITNNKDLESIRLRLLDNAGKYTNQIVCAECGAGSGIFIPDNRFPDGDEIAILRRGFWFLGFEKGPICSSCRIKHHDELSATYGGKEIKLFMGTMV